MADLPADLARLLPELMTLVHKVETQQTLQLWSDWELTMPQLIALHVLDAGGPNSVSGLQAQLRLSASATSHLVDRLVSKGLVERAEDPADRRQKVVRIEPEGLDVLRRLNTARYDQVREGVSLLSPDLQARLHDVVQEAITELRAAGARKCPGS